LQFTTTGVRKWATYYGGSRECYGTSIFSDGKDVWVTGYAFAVDFPTFNPGGGAFYQGSLEELCRFGYGNAFILKFTTSGICEWSTYYGNCDDWGASIYSNGTNVWIAGNTSSINFPTQDPGGGAYFQGTPGSSTNNGDYIFILQFDTACVRKWATYYGDGGGGGDQANCIQSDGTSVWVTGYTESKNFPTFNPGNGAYYQDTLAATFYSSNAFILQFSNTGVRKWATYYGGSGSKFGGNSDEGLSIYSDSINVWVSGITGSTNFPTLNPGNGAYFQDSIGGTVVRRNSFILQFSTNGVRKWATYYGGAGNVNGAGDFANSINSDRKNVWVCGWAGSLNLPLLDPGGGAFFEDTTD
ncbi:MAG TPA: hypothetical protein VN922_20925, partial [Bacteroidia bacterium]|nr:hypothetical protein [Bacteroidia bacterium]